MKVTIKTLVALLLLFQISCKQSETDSSTENQNSNTTEESVDLSVGQEGVQDEVSNPNIVQVASGSPDHTTLVAAVKAAGLVTSLSNAGPFTVFAPTNSAFDKLPAGTVEDLLKPENKDKLVDILGYHTYVGVLKPEYMQDGGEYEMVTPKKVKITKDGDKTFVNGSEITATIETSNGLILVINDVLLPK
ncbi:MULTISPECIES: fasciclin domain-containing protein [Flavobacterium]|uniref:Uncaracterized surface protein containing fasciclin (FAS1) repeats n=2 Tax=Flavobacterium TaxID=237 RepID=A0A1M6J4J8_9FLAO|nr:MULTISPECIES: fasciclin domain-containing protein [Flavobacterium]BCY28346.1 hypothetical protein KK2020170_12140 [Flavobacterium okayamense]SHJ41602.1 Uncaracterized surface protein containing fasciclin (FAS1) repeats [Flavobacterium haoranii]